MFLRGKERGLRSRQNSFFCPPRLLSKEIFFATYDEVNHYLSSMVFNNNILLWIAIGGLIVGGLILIGGPDSKTDTTAHLNREKKTVEGGVGVLRADERSYAFGTISMKDGNVRHSFAVKNEGSKEVTIKKIYTSCMCTTAILHKEGKKFGPFGMQGHGIIPSINQKLQPGEEVRVEVIFNPAAHGPAGVGKIERVVYLENDASPQPFELNIAATVTP